MANFHTLVSFYVPMSADQVAWVSRLNAAMNQYAEVEAEVPDSVTHLDQDIYPAFKNLVEGGHVTGGGCALDHLQTDNLPSALWVHGENTQLESLVAILREQQKMFGTPIPIAFTWAETCDRDRMGAFSGGGVIITPDETHWMSVNTWIQDKQAEVENALKAKAADA